MKCLFVTAFVNRQTCPPYLSYRKDRKALPDAEFTLSSTCCIKHHANLSPHYCHSCRLQNLLKCVDMR
jgi:hypothetical protein